MAQARLTKEYKDFQSDDKPFVRNVRINDTNLFEWRFTIVPNAPPFNVAMFDTVMTFPSMYIKIIKI